MTLKSDLGDCIDNDVTGFTSQEKCTYVQVGKLIDMSFPNNPETEQREYRGPRVHFNDGSHLPPTPHDNSDALLHVSHPQPVARSSIETASPQRFTNPFGGSEWEPDNPISNPALDGVTLYHTQLPVCGSGTLDAHRDVLEPSRGSFHASSQAEMPPTRDRYLWSSYQHPYEIEPPSGVYNNATFGPTRRRPTIGSIGNQRDNISEGSTTRQFQPRYSAQDSESFDAPLAPTPRRFRGGFANMLELWRVYWQQAPDQSEYVAPYDALFGDGYSRPGLMRSRSSVGYDPDDPKITGTKKLSQDDPEDAESQCRQEMNLQYMSYRQRRKEAQKIKIQFNVTCKLCFFSSSDSSVLSPLGADFHSPFSFLPC